MQGNTKDFDSKRWLFHGSWIWLTWLLFAASAWAQGPALEKVRLGVILDADDPGITDIWEQTLKEIRALLKTSAEVSVVSVLQADWSPERAENHYQTLVADSRVDIILSYGVVTGTVVSKTGAFPKPVVALGLLDSVSRESRPEKGSTSGVNNLSLVLLNTLVEKDLAYYREIYPFKKIALVYTKGLEGLVNDEPSFRGEGPLVKDIQTELVFAGFDVAATVAAIPQDVDAVYLGFIPEYSEVQWRSLADGINRRKLPSFGWDLPLIEYGVMATNATGTDSLKLARRIALNVEAIVSGTNAGDLPVLFDFEKRLTLNQKTMRLVGYHPPWDILSRAEFVEDDFEDTARQIDMADVFEEARTRSLDIRQAAQDLEVSRTDVDLARGQLRPFIDLGATGSRIDKDRARASQGSQSENTWSSGISLQQVIYSERARAGVDLQRFAAESQNHQNSQLLLDITLEASLAYLDVLRSRAQIEIRKQDLQQTRRNLEIAKQRESVGYSGRSDVYRWESQVATANQQIIEARVQYYLAQSQLNRLLNRPQDTAFRIKETGTAEMKLAGFYQEGFSNYLRTPHDLEILVEFLTQESRKILPEIKSLDAGIAAQQRQLRLDQRTRFVPEVALQGNGNYLLSRGGEGSSSMLPGTPEDLSWSVALNFSIPLFKGGTIRQQVAKSSIQMRGLEIQRDNLLQALELSIRFQLGELVNAYFNLGSSSRASEMADLSLDLVKDGYAKGSLPIAQLLDAQIAATNASEAAAIAQWDHVAAILRLERAIGRYSLTDSEADRAEDLQRFLAFSQQKRK